MNLKAADGLGEVSMEEAVGYSSIACEHQTPVEHALVLKHDRFFFISDPHGDIKPPGQCSLGLFYEDTRILSHYALRMFGGPPSLLSAQILRSYAGQIDLAVKDEEFGGSSWDPKNCIHIRRQILVDDCLLEKIEVTNYLERPVVYWIELALGCDFADIFEVRGWKRERRGEFLAPRIEEGRLIFGYRGRDGEIIQSVTQFQKPYPELTAEGARWKLEIGPNVHFETEWRVGTEVCAPQKRVEIEEKREQMSALYEEWRSCGTRWETPVQDFQDTLDRAVDDIRALYINVEDSSVISAGIPWYSTIFGRDSIITSLQTLSLTPQIAKDTLLYLARYQGEKEDQFTGEEPGKILHELRRGEMARNREIPHLPYYGTIDATPLWLILLHETWMWTGDSGLVRKLLPNAERALEWIDRFGDLDGDGFLEYENQSAGGLANQGWKDSSDGVPFPDGTLPRSPIALVEVQGYVYDAKMRMAKLFDVFGNPARAERLRSEAEQLRQKIIERFWIEELGMFALALDGGKKRIPTVTSNAGHLLWSGVPTDEQARRMADVLLSEEMFSGWGIRTLSAAHRVFNPMSYHNGSIWPHDNSLVVMGLRRYQLAARALPVIRGLYDASIYGEFQRLPELFCGMARGKGKHPVQYPVSCSPQAWASGTFFMLMQATLGIQPDAPRRILHISNPLLPDFINQLVLTNLTIGNSKVSLQFDRYRDRTLANLISASGEPLQVRIELN